MISILCPCSINDEEIDASSVLSVPSEHLLPLEYLYFCQKCCTLACARCTEKAVASIYCPSCLFEVTPSTAKDDRNRCMRGCCFQCPKCLASASVLSTNEGYTMNCNYCDWVSSPLDKNVSIARHLRNCNVDSDFDILRQQYYEMSVKELTKFQISASSPSSGVHIFDEQMDMSEAAKFARDKELIPSNLSQALPVRLRAKYSRKCRACRTTLIKPDPKPSSVGFKKKSMAMHYLPQIRVTTTSPSSTTASDSAATRLYLLDIVNTSPSRITIKISTPLSSKLSGYSVSILCPKVTLEPGTAHLDEYSLIKSVPTHLIIRKSLASSSALMETVSMGALPDGIHSQNGNWACLSLDIDTPVKHDTVNRPLPAFPLFIQCTIHGDEYEKEMSVGYWVLMDLKDCDNNLT